MEIVTAKAEATPRTWLPHTYTNERETGRSQQCTFYEQNPIDGCYEMFSSLQQIPKKTRWK